MSAELKYSLTVTYENGSAKDAIAAEQISYDQTTQGMGADTFAVATSEGDLVVGTVTAGWYYLKNLDATNFVKFGPKSGGSMVEFGRLPAGKTAWVYVPSGVTIRAIADTATCKVLVKAYKA